MSPTEIQVAIINKDWAALSKVPWWEFDGFMKHRTHPIPKEFFLDFLTTVDAGNAVLQSYEDLIPAMNGLDFSYNDYTKMLKSADIVYNITLFDLTKDKTQEFLEFYLDNSDRILELRKDVAMVATVASFTKKLLGDGSLNERFAKLLNSDINVLRRIVTDGLKADAVGLQFLKEYINDDIKLALLETKSASTDVLELVTKNASEESIIDYISDDKRIAYYNVFPNLSNIGYTFSDKGISNIISAHKKYAVSVMTKEQITKFKDELGIVHIKNSNKLTLDEVADLFPGKQSSTPPAEFHTEEEMVKHPQLFNPKSDGTQLLYFTRETLKILNREWGTRQRYDENSSDVNRVFDSNIYSITPKMIRYLESKGEIDWVNALHKMTLRAYDNPKLKAVSDFLAKYKE